MYLLQTSQPCVSARLNSTLRRPGSSPYADGTDGGSDANKPSDVWKTDFTSLKAKVEKIGANKIGKKTK